MRVKGVRTVKTTLFDQSVLGRRRSENSGADVTISMSDAFIEIGIDGYGEKEGNVGDGSPVVLEKYEGKLRLIVFADINKDEPTHIISLEGALESARNEQQ
jgi:hypothetical protein